MNALRRRPLQIAGLALRTYMGYWGIASIHSYAREDLGGVDLTDDQIKMLAQKFRFATVKWITSQPLSLLQWYFVRAWPYYFIVVVSPLVCAFVEASFSISPVACVTCATDFFTGKSLCCSSAKPAGAFWSHSAVGVASTEIP